MTEPSEAKWSIETDSERFAELKMQERFWQLVALSRAVSELRFVQYALTSHQQEEESPRANRTRLNSFFLNCSLLFEALLLVQRLPKYFRDNSAFSGLREILKDPIATELRNSAIAPVRNWSTFHFDEGQIGAQLVKATTPHRFVLGQGETNADVHYELADLCTLAIFAESSLDDPNLVKALEKRIGDVTAIAIRFMDAAENFINEVLKQDGWEMR